MRSAEASHRRSSRRWRLAAAATTILLTTLSGGGVSPVGAQVPAPVNNDVLTEADLENEHLNDDHARVLRLYWAFFDRAPEKSGAEFWISEIDTCRPLSSVAEFFAASDEFAATYGDSIDDSAFVGIVYDNVLDRAPDGEGFEFWVKEIAEGRKDRVDVMLDFAWSDEFTLARPLPSDGVTAALCQEASQAFTFAPAGDSRILSVEPLTGTVASLTLAVEAEVDGYIFRNAATSQKWTIPANEDGAYSLAGLAQNEPVVFGITALSGEQELWSSEARSIDMIDPAHFGPGWFVKSVEPSGGPIDVAITLACSPRPLSFTSSGTVPPDPETPDRIAVVSAFNDDPQCFLSHELDFHFDEARRDFVTWNGEAVDPLIQEGAALLPVGTLLEELEGSSAEIAWIGLPLLPSSKFYQAPGHRAFSGVVRLEADWTASYVAQP